MNIYNTINLSICLGITILGALILALSFWLPQIYRAYLKKYENSIGNNAVIALLLSMVCVLPIALNQQNRITDEVTAYWLILHLFILLTPSLLKLTKNYIKRKVLNNILKLLRERRLRSDLGEELPRIAYALTPLQKEYLDFEDYGLNTSTDKNLLDVVSEKLAE